jgi:hypothetical protein
MPARRLEVPRFKRLLEMKARPSKYPARIAGTNITPRYPPYATEIPVPAPSARVDKIRTTTRSDQCSRR